MNIFITESSNYALEALNIYSESGCRVFRRIANNQNHLIDCLLVRLNIKINQNYIQDFPNLKYIISPTTALTHIDIKECNRRKIRIISLRDCKKSLNSITSSSEHALALSLSIVRQLPRYFELGANSNWDRYKYPIRELSALKIGIIGLGRIGKKLFNIFKMIGSDVYWYDIKKIRTQLKFFLDKKNLIMNSDLIVICASFNEGDKPIISHKEIKLFNNKKFLVNISRGGTISDDVIEKLFREDLIYGYATDVIAQEDQEKGISSSVIYKLLKEGFNIIITPHIGGAAIDAMSKAEILVAKKFCKLIKK